MTKSMKDSKVQSANSISRKKFMKMSLATAGVLAFSGSGFRTLMRNKSEDAQSDPQTYAHIRVTDKNSRVSTIEPVTKEYTPQWARKVSQHKFNWSKGAITEGPYFEGATPFVLPPKDQDDPFYSHNHQPAITWLRNGDLLAIWYSTRDERGLELTVLASRYRAGAESWDPSSEFFKAPNRNMHGSSIFRDRQGKIYHINGMGPDGVSSYMRLALLIRTSKDNGATWSSPRTFSTGANYQNRHQPIAGAIITHDGKLIQPCDDLDYRTESTSGRGIGSALHIRSDNSKTWYDPGGTIRGIHAGIVELKDGRLMAFGRLRSLDGTMPMSLSEDGGNTWSYHKSPFPRIGSGQRIVLKRLREGPIFLVSFTSGNVDDPESNGMAFKDANGKTFTGYGMFGALSFDEGKTWPVRRLITPNTKGEYDGGGNTGKFIASSTHAEPGGYLDATQPPNGIIHLISSRLHYRFNLAWLIA